MTTLFDAILELAKIITPVIEGVATGGSTSTLVDSTRTEPDEHFSLGTIFFRSGNLDGISLEVSDYDLGTTTFTFATQAAAAAADDLYSVCDDNYPRWLLIQAINEALQDLGRMPAVDVSLESVDDQEAYDLPTGVRNVVRVEVATSTTTPYNYRPHYNWKEFGDDLWFDEGQEPPGGYIIRLTYLADHAALTADDDEITPYVHVRRLKWMAACHALRWKLRNRDGSDQIQKELSEAIAQAELMANLYKIDPRISRDPHLANW